MAKSILHIINSLDQGGAQNILLNLCKYNSHQKHHIVYLTKSSFYVSSFQSIGIDPVLIEVKPRNFIAASLFLFRYIKKLKPFAVQTWLYHSDLIGGIVSRLAGIKNISWGVHHSDHTFSTSKISTLLTVCLAACLSHFIPKNIIYCALTAKLFHERIFFSKHKSRVIFNGYDADEFRISHAQRELFRSKFCIPSDALVFGVAARFHPVKDHKTVFHALSILKSYGLNFTLVLAGEKITQDNSALLELIDNFDLRQDTILLGSYDSMNTFYNSIDILLLSSVSEAFPNVVFESLLAGTVCVCTNVGDLYQVLPLKPYLTSISQPFRFADKISNLLSDMANQVSNISPKIVRNYALQNFSARYMSTLYSEVWHS